MHKTEVRGASWLAMGLLASCFSGCGGGGSTPPLQLRAQIATATADGSWKVCLDGNQNMACDAGEPVATIAADGRYQLTLPHDTPMTDRYWVAESVTAGTSAVLRLAAPASSRVISSLSTLVVAQLLKGGSTANTPATRLAGSQSEVAGRLGLPATTNLLALPDEGPIGAIADTAMAALQAGVAAAAQAANPGTQAQLIPLTVLDVMAHYADADSGGLLPTVTTRTIKSEVAAAFNPPQCSIAAPQRLYIDTDDAAPIVSKEDYLQARLRTDASTIYGAALDLKTQIRGRGNSTWSMPKKPYKLKLSKATALLGMSADKEWALLANYADKTLLRNAVAFCLSETLGLSYTPAYRFVELELNGEYQGVYQLTEQIKDAPHRVDIGSATPVGDDPGGFLLEIDARLDADDWFYSERSRLPYTFKSDTNPTQKDQVARLIGQFEDALFGDDFMTRGPGGYLPLLDSEAMIDFYLVNELMYNVDAYWSSTFVTRKDNGPLTFGPVWDFDIAAGNVNYSGHDSPTDGSKRKYSPYLERLFTDPAFKRHALARWQFLSSRMPALQSFIRQSAATLDAAQQRNFQTWDILGIYVWPNAVVTGSYAGEIDYLSNWLQARQAWIDADLAALAGQDLTAEQGAQR